MPGKRALAVIEFALWVLAATVGIVAASLALGLLVGGDLLTGKYVLFVVGFLVFGLGSFLIQPSRPRPDRAPEASRSHTPDSLSHDTTESDGESAADGGRGRPPDGGSIRDVFGPSDTHQHRYEAKLQTIGPLADYDLPYGQRISRRYKVFATGLLVLAFSFVMELVGVQV